MPGTPEFRVTGRFRSLRARLLAVAALCALLLSISTAMVLTQERPDAVSGLTAEAGPSAGELVVHWDPHPDAPDGYRVAWARTGESYRGLNNTEWNAFPTATSYTISGLAPGAEYRVRVRARWNDSISSRWTPEVLATSADETDQRRGDPRQADTTAPTLDTATVDGASLVLTYDEALDEDSVPAANAYSVVVNSGAAAAPSSVAIGGSAVTLTLASAVLSLDTVTVSYTVPMTNPLQDDAANGVAALSNEAVTNQTDPIFLVANHAQTDDGNQLVGNNGLQQQVAQAFTTGANPGGYELKSVSLIIESLGASATPVVSITSANNSNNPGTVRGILTNPATLSEGATTFTSSDAVGVPLRANTTYFVLIQNSETTESAAHQFSVEKTGDDGEDGGGTSGWSIADTGLGKSGDSVWDSAILSANSIKIKIVGEAVTNGRPTFNAGLTRTLSVRENRALGEIGQALNVSDPDDNNNALTYDISSTPSGKFGFAQGSRKLALVSALDYEDTDEYTILLSIRDNKDADGNSDSAIDSTITITVNVTNVDEAGTVSVVGTLTAGQTLSASLTDPDGSVTNTTWQWQRASTAAGTYTDISTATSSTYVLDTADAGNFVRAVASYDDGHGTGKSATSAAQGQIAGSNAPPQFGAATANRAVDENAGASVAVGNPVTATDADMDTLTYSLSGTDASSFTINSSTGQIQTATGVTYDFESTKKTYVVTVEVKDNKNAAGDADTTEDADDTIAVTITVVNVD